MIYKIDAETIAAAGACKHGHRCLFDKKFSCGEVVSEIGHKIIFVNCHLINCAFRINYGHSVICNCPVKRKIHFSLRYKSKKVGH